MTIYPSKKSTAIILFLSVILIGTGLLMAFSKSWAGLIVIAMVAAFITYLFMTTNYTIDNKLLKIKCGFIISKSIDIKTINKISETNNPLSAPALSLDRLEIRFNGHNTVLISPENKESFIRELKSIQPDIEVQLKSK